MLEHVIRHLISYGFTDIVVNIHHFGQQIVDFLRDNGNFGVNIQVSDERGELLDTGGGILKARPLLDDGEPFLVHNADIMTDLNLADFYNYHLHHSADASVLVAERATSRYFVFDSSRRLQGWENVTTGETRPEGFVPSAGQLQLAFGGVHVISPTVFDALAGYTDAHKFSITPFYVDMCRRLKIMGYIPDTAYRWFDIGSPEKLAQAEAAITGSRPLLFCQSSVTRIRGCAAGFQSDSSKGPSPPPPRRARRSRSPLASCRRSAPTA